MAVAISRKRTVDMVHGSILNLLVAFSIPLLLGNLFQQFYNLVDTWVVGNYVSNEAFSAVGTVSPITNILISLFTGLSSGVTVVIAQLFGAERSKAVSNAVHSSIVLAVVIGVATTAFGIIATPTLLSWMNTPSSVLLSAKEYLIIYCFGLVGLSLYNTGSAILRAVGDSFRPFCFLIVSSVVNILLDLVFVIRLNLGVKGVAYATVVSEYLSAGLVIVSLFRADGAIKLSFKHLHIDRRLAKKMFNIGFPTTLQIVLMSFSNIFVQAYINAFGPDVMSGWTAYFKIDQVIFLPMQSTSIAVTTFVGQNLGTGDIIRAKHGIRVGFLMIVACSVIFITPVMIFAESLVSFFNSKKEVVFFGALMLRWISPFYFFNGVTHVYMGGLRGAGNTRIPTIIMLLSLIAVRHIYLLIVSNFISKELVLVVLGYPVGMLVCGISIYIYYRLTNLMKYRVVED